MDRYASCDKLTRYKLNKPKRENDAQMQKNIDKSPNMVII